ncbi:MAG TPA: T9SS type A sorting domain-containing protein, partial [Ignavibacteria bacterium]|nr:T9SS type A sorting domain-containing protein [Ignavibacteria bacterium]HRK00932.1 T9SS type A sorting domain-containing protein [Ignavibacteria bacterium]
KAAPFFFILFTGNLRLYLKLLCIFLFIFNFSISDIRSQEDCATLDFPSGAPYSDDFIGGFLKPQRTDYSNGIYSNNNTSFHMLFVFVQFTNESDNDDNWPIGDPPNFMNDFLDSVKSTSGDFWNRYNEHSLSDYYQEVSMGAFHVTGETRHLITDHTWSFYDNLTFGYDTLLTEIYNKLKNDTTIIWSTFDQWSRNITTGEFENVKDNYLDMMGIFFRRVLGHDFIASGIGAGEVPLYGPDNVVLFANSTDTVKIDRDRAATGSGFTAKGNLGVLSYKRAMGIAIHEYGHYLFSNVHSTSGIMTSRGGISLNDLFMSGFERYKLGLNDTITANFNSVISYSLRDVSGRNGSSQVPNFTQILKVPITSSDFFIVENRRKISDWDVYMLGDTSQNDPFKNTSDYGKGVYIYHNNNNGINYAGNIDLECADGLWNWDSVGTEHPDWDNNQTLNVYIRKTIPKPLLNDPGTWGNMNNRDGLSAAFNITKAIYFDIGEKHTQVNSLPGTIKNYTNNEEHWTTRELWGDRNDAWNIGYNQIFSPYSNPNTKSSGSAETGIFIYYKSLTNEIANIDVYKVDQPLSLDSILHITPPSKPMGLVVDYHLETENIMRPILTWNHNMEPDMLNTSNNKKKYKIWRATSTGMNVVPTNYTVHNIVEIDSGTAPSYIDTTIYALGSGWPGMGNTIEYPVRYKIQAVDIYQDTSVRSDFDMAVGLVITDGCAECHEEEGPDSFINDTEIPKEFVLYNNYPNPFNPSTSIKFDLPKDVLVSIKIFDILGREVRTLVNDFKTAGRYTVTFSGADLSSGIYYYKIKAGDFEQVRKMMLLK